MAARDYIVVTEDGKEMLLPGVLSITKEDVVNYDNSVYRDSLGQDVLGRAVISNVSQSFTVPGGTGTLTATGLEGVWEVKDGTDTYAIGGEVVRTDPYFEEDDAFNHVPPHQTEKKDTRYCFWTGATGTGDLVGSVWKSQGPIWTSQAAVVDAQAYVRYIS